MIEKRTATAKHFVDAQGEFTAVISGQAIHYQTDQGDWRDINTTILPSQNANYTHENVSNAIQSYYGTNGVLITSDNHSITVGKNPMIVWMDASGAINTLEEGVLTTVSALARKVEYTNAFQNGSIEYVIGNAQVKNNLVLNSIPTEVLNQNGFLGYSEEIIVPTGWEIVTENVQNGFSSGSLHVYNERREEMFVIPSPIAFDANPNSISVSGENSNATYKLMETTNGYQLITFVELNWLNASNRQFPITYLILQWYFLQFQVDGRTRRAVLLRETHLLCSFLQDLMEATILHGSISIYLRFLLVPWLIL